MFEISKHSFLAQDTLSFIIHVDLNDINNIIIGIEGNGLYSCSLLNDIDPIKQQVWNIYKNIIYFSNNGLSRSSLDIYDVKLHVTDEFIYNINKYISTLIDYKYKIIKNPL